MKPIEIRPIADLHDLFIGLYWKHQTRVRVVEEHKLHTFNRTTFFLVCFGIGIRIRVHTYRYTQPWS